MTEQERTPDGRYVVVDGRRWRASDPNIPERLQAELVKELMTARRLVKTRGDDVRFRVQDAKVALGERGEEWWEPTDQGRRTRLESVIRALLRHRDGSTICPSDAARAVGGEDWRDLMDAAREVAGELAEQGQVRITQKGEDVDIHARGPIRLGAGPDLRT
ncbi:DUF3253 domain-containing protein [Nesterenkonia massiliensis]|uniref:DUF3253 domain-containing protein n=1 Tax=Nesterenkonia massiliensis TaxID=1232429 RepID=A0ABT2HQP7_9MICC|nr:DUF3253 domain-containing protein [Nesterenkonia massiliensis]MCT1607014.1 DUF3253 domain-containing protein [Nesterenkonia massiliensis]